MARRDVSVVGGVNGITVDGVRDTVLDGVSVSGAHLDGIHVRLGGIVIKDCNVDMIGNALGQGIDISYNMGMGMSMVEGCTVVGGMEGITTHSSMSDIVDNHVSRTTQNGISVTEMSMGMVMNNEVRDALGVGIYCNDRSMCDIRRNTVVDTRSDGTPARRGFGVLSSFQSEADLRGNELAANPVPYGAVIESQVATTH
ncbi:MAG TPA: right-handed parallel beta-helix repeat-containing protein [Gaiellaceae bacterium]|nr:right-handed parallel beta-helix repeat-containing protein [Gaiellaceae bacterium]